MTCTQNELSSRECTYPGISCLRLTGCTGHRCKIHQATLALRVHPPLSSFPFPPDFPVAVFISHLLRSSRRKHSSLRGLNLSVSVHQKSTSSEFRTSRIERRRCKGDDHTRRMQLVSVLLSSSTSRRATGRIKNSEAKAPRFVRS